MKMKVTILSLLSLGIFSAVNPSAQACSRAVYIGPDQLVITGRTMDWKEDIQTNLYLLPRGMDRAGSDKANTVRWTSKYGSIVATGYDIGTSDGMNEKGLVVNMLYLKESVYTRPGDTRPEMGMSVWPQYVLDNFASVSEAVQELKKETFRIHAPHMPGGQASTLHMAISDATGNSAILEYIDGKLNIHEGKQYQIMTNSPTYDKLLAINEYWQEIGGLVMLPGTNRSADRFVRASFYIHALPQTTNTREAVAGVFGVMRNVSVPLGITIPEQPNLSSTRWCSVSDQKNKIYYFAPTLNPEVFWVDLTQADFSAGAPVKKLNLVGGEIYSGEVIKEFKDSKPFTFMFEVP